MVAPLRRVRRDLGYSVRHRLYGRDCPACDLDFIEFDGGQPAALVEMKWQHERDSSAPVMATLEALADRARLPLFVARHAEDFATFEVTPVNALARRFLAGRTILTEREWVVLLYRVRNRVAPPELLAGLGRAKP